MKQMNPHFYTFAIAAQSACNLTGVMNSTADVIEELADDPDIWQHGVVRLMAEQCWYLAESASGTKIEPEPFEGGPLQLHTAFRSALDEVWKTDQDTARRNAATALRKPLAMLASRVDRSHESWHAAYTEAERLSQTEPAAVAV